MNLDSRTSPTSRTSVELLIQHELFFWLYFIYLTLYRTFSVYDKEDMDVRRVGVRYVMIPRVLEKRTSVYQNDPHSRIEVNWLV